MTRLIDADAFQDEFKDHLEYALKLLTSNRHKNAAEMVESFGKDIKRIIANAPTVQREGWVSVKDAMPDYSGTQQRIRVLVYWEDTKAVFTLWYGLRFGLKEPEFYEENEWTESNDGEIDENDNLYLGEYLSFKNITHWQYLPAAPKE